MISLFVVQCCDIEKVYFRSSIPTEKTKMLVDSGVAPSSYHDPTRVVAKTSATSVCEVCFETLNCDKFAALSCKHSFCRDCWRSHMEFMILDGMNSGQM